MTASRRRCAAVIFPFPVPGARSRTAVTALIRLSQRALRDHLDLGEQGGEDRWDMLSGQARLRVLALLAAGDISGCTSHTLVHQELQATTKLLDEGSVTGWSISLTLPDTRLPTTYRPVFS